MNVLGELFLVAACVLIQAFFAGSETAVVAADRLMLASRADAGDIGAQRVLKLLETPARLVGMCLLGANVATIAGATLLTHLLSRFVPASELIVIAIFTPLTVIFAGVIPKGIFLQNANVLAPALARSLGALQTVFALPLWITDRASKLALALAGVDATHVHTVRREDIQLLLDSAETGDIRAEEKEMILRVFDFSETKVCDAMVPLIEVVAVSESATCEEAAALLVEHAFSRMPVFRKRVDRIVGVVTHSDVMFVDDPSRAVGTVAKDIIFVPETKRVDELFLDLRRRRQRIAVAVDEYGGAVGLISIEDILEEIVGDIEDEFDRRRPLVRKLGEKAWLASGRVEAENLYAATGFEMPDGDYETLAGFLLSRLGHVPTVGERIGWGTHLFTIAKANDRAILEVEIQRTTAAVGKKP